jgi:hypothetical protein
MKDTSHTVLLHLPSDICINILQHNYLVCELSGTGVRHDELNAFRLFCSFAFSPVVTLTSLCLR